MLQDGDYGQGFEAESNNVEFVPQCFGLCFCNLGVFAALQHSWVAVTAGSGCFLCSEVLGILVCQAAFTALCE